MNNYLAGAIFGFRTFEGRDEMDSCWGHNPGTGDIEQLMKEELGSWYGPGLEFELSYDSNFDIDDFFDSHDFPELRARIRHEVLSCLFAVEEGLRTETGVFPDWFAEREVVVIGAAKNGSLMIAVE